MLPGCEAHHLRVKGERGVGMRATDKWALPLTPDEHREIHHSGSRKEKEWFAARGVDCYELSRALWANRERGIEVLYAVLRAHKTEAK